MPLRDLARATLVAAVSVPLTRTEFLQLLHQLGFNEIDACKICQIMDRESGAGRATEVMPQAPLPASDTP